VDIIDKIDESIFGKQKSKGWFKYRGLIAGSKVRKDLTKLLVQIEKSMKNGEVSSEEMNDLVNQIHIKYSKV
jgi:hypothetical protein